MLHVHSGDCAAKMVSRLVGGAYIIWTDNLFEGPLPRAAWDDTVWREARAAALADHLGGRDRAGVMLGKRYDAAKELLARGDEVTLWFDSCLYDMMLLCQFLRFTEGMLDQAPLWLVCEELRGDGRRFAGYAELDETELAALYARRCPLTAEMMRDARESWEAFTSPRPGAWLELTRKDHPLTSFLAPAARRLLEQLPDPRGLNRLEAEIMTALAGGCTQLKALFEEVSAAEERPFFGDTVVWQALDRLAAAHVPLVELRGPAEKLPLDVFPPPGVPAFDADAWRVTATPEGVRTLRGEGSSRGAWDRERWVANVKVTPGRGPFYDRGHGRLTAGL